jgi:uncharacterized UBP type Zn finger protein
VDRFAGKQDIQAGILLCAFAPSLIRRNHMTDECTHLDQIKEVTPSADGCENCLRIGSTWVHLRLCMICGHVGCCDSSPHKHATKHFQATKHPIIKSFQPGEEWGWCYVDEVMFDEL